MPLATLYDVNGVSRRQRRHARINKQSGELS
jgi:hypothetical protein